MSAVERTKAIILRRTNYGEADRILTLLTPLGKRSAIARGVRREKSRLAGGIELFAVSDMVLQRGRGGLYIVTQARLDCFYRNILQDYDRLQFGYECIKLVERASRDIDAPEWFEVLQETLAGLGGATPLQLVQTWFYLHYAELTGYELSLVNDVAGQALDSQKHYMYDSIDRGLRLSEQGEITADHIKFLRLAASKPLRVVAQVGGVEQVLPDCWLLARQHAAI